MNAALIFAGGTGKRMNSKALPKQFLELHGKPIIIYTIEHFEKHKDIDAILVVCVKDWIPYFNDLLKKFAIKKVVATIPGGSSGQESIYNGLCALNERFDGDTVVLIHDGVRPVIDGELISKNIQCVKNNGNAITVSRVVETVAVDNGDGSISEVYDRSRILLAKAPQSFYLNRIFTLHQRALSENLTGFIDSASMLRHYNYRLNIVEGSPDNIKITTPNDFYMFRAIMDIRENAQIFG